MTDNPHIKRPMSLFGKYIFDSMKQDLFTDYYRYAKHPITIEGKARVIDPIKRISGSKNVD